MNKVAHIRSSDGTEQTVREHLLGVQQLAESYGNKIGVKHLAGLAGVLHDLGKYSDDFQVYIREAVANPDSPTKRGTVDHSTAGGKLLYDLFHKRGKTALERVLAEVMGNVIISHHSYLQDYLNDSLQSPYLKRVKKKELNQTTEVRESLFRSVITEDDFNSYTKLAIKELEVFIQGSSGEKLAENLMFLTKYLFSTLIDADRTDSMMFEEGLSEIAMEDRRKLFERYYSKLMQQLNLFEENVASDNRIGQLRKEMSKQCEQYAENRPGIYTLSIPTGGGKTLASLRYALRHALKYGKERIIYIVPYTTIIEQNAEEVRRILEDDSNILEFHSNVIENEEINEDDDFFNHAQKVKLSKESWDSPIIFTTMVQYLNVFYDSGTRSIRRLHNLAKSVIVFDEVQKVPTACVSLFNQSVNFLKNHCQSTVLLCTATQPSLDYVQNKLDINSDGEMIHDLQDVVDAFKRVELIDYASEATFTTGKLSQFVQKEIQEESSVLVILNTRKVVRELYVELSNAIDNVSIYHLSTSMCAAHRKDLLHEMRERLKNNEKVICVSTQLIEAGVDISFKSVVRSLAGLDSIAQAAGRCNRHGECADLGKVYIIEHSEENLDRLKEIRVGKEIAQKLLIDIKRDKDKNINDILSNEIMSRYFQEFYSEFKMDLDYPVAGYRESMVEMLTDSKGKSERHQAYMMTHKKELELLNISSMQTAANKFQVIESNTTSVIVPYGKGEQIIEKLISAETITDLNKLLKEAQQYIVNIYDHEKQLLTENNGIYAIFDSTIYILTDGVYDTSFGMSYTADASLKDLFY